MSTTSLLATMQLASEPSIATPGDIERYMQVSIVFGVIMVIVAMGMLAKFGAHRVQENKKASPLGAMLDWSAITLSVGVPMTLWMLSSLVISHTTGEFILIVLGKTLLAVVAMAAVGLGIGLFAHWRINLHFESEAQAVDEIAR